ncbi:MAG: MBL fold metallo-hydrolase [Ginsengibacter sp.]
MSLFITSLNSGSNGNCYYVGNEREAVLIDAGISCREIEKRMKRLGLTIQNVKAVFVSHEHSDHIKGLTILVKKYHLPVYITPKTMRNGGLNFEEELLRIFNAHEPVSVGSLSIIAFPKFHDASDPYSFIVNGNETCVGIFTDIGTPCQQVIKYFHQCHAAFLEANYDDQMLEKGNYPIYLKNRIRGGNGHLSNLQALDLFVSHRSDFMSHLLLSHLSKNNNSPELVKDLFMPHAEKVQIIVTSRYQETELFEIHINKSGIKSTVKNPVKKLSSQLSLSFG